MTADGTATAGADYDARPATTLSFGPGVATQTFTVIVRGDDRFEGDETFAVDLSGASGALIVRGQATATIVDDEPIPGLTISDASVTECNGGTVDAVCTVRLSAAAGVPVQVGYWTADDSAKAGSDYDATSGVLAFAPGDVAKTVVVKVHGDTTEKANKRFFVNLSGPVNATLTDARGRGHGRQRRPRD